MSKRPKTLAARLTLWYAAIFVVFTGVAFILFYFSINSILNNQMDEDLEEDIEEFALLLKTDGIQWVKKEIQREVMSDDPEDIFLRLLDGEGRQLFSSDLKPWGELTIDSESLKKVSSGEGPELHSMPLPADEDYDVRIILGLLGPGVILHMGESMEDQQEFMEIMLSIFVTTFVVVIALAAVVGWFMAKQALKGVDEVSRAAMNVANGTLDCRVSVQTKGEEIERLVATFNIMVDRIRALISGMREMTDNIAHDLRSPLARIRANSELALAGAKTIKEHETAAADTLEECDRLLQMINTTLDVAEAEVGVTELQKNQVDISKVVQDACELFEPIAEDKEISLSRELKPNCRINGNIQFLQRMLANLLDNALKYTPPKGKVDVIMLSDEKAISISVRDTGIGISRSDQSSIFKRFYRCDESRSKEGCGMGLSLARAVARAHGGDIKVSSKPGSGSVFTVTLDS